MTRSSRAASTSSLENVVNQNGKTAHRPGTRTRRLSRQVTDSNELMEANEMKLA